MKIEMQMGSRAPLTGEIDDIKIVEADTDILTELVEVMETGCYDLASDEFFEEWTTANPRILDALSHPAMTPEVKKIFITKFASDFLKWLSQKHNVDIIVKKFS